MADEVAVGRLAHRRPSSHYPPHVARFRRISLPLKPSSVARCSIPSCIAALRPPTAARCSIPSYIAAPQATNRRTLLDSVVHRSPSRSDL